MRKILQLFVALLILSTTTTKAQIGIGTTTPDSSAMLDIKDTTRGLLIPRMKMVNRTHIVSPATGLMVYQTDGIKGFWYYNGSSWQSLSSGGKHTIVLSDTITNSQAQAKIDAEVGPNTQEIKIVGCTNLTSVDLSMITEAISVDIEENPVLQNIDLGSLSSCVGNLIFYNCPSLTSLNLSSLYYVNSIADLYGIYIYNTALANVNLPIKRVFGSVTISKNLNLSSISFPNLNSATYCNMDISSNAHLVSFSIPLLPQLQNLSVYTNPLFTALTANNLTVAGSLGFQEDSSLILVSLPNLTSGLVDVSSNNSLTTISLPALAASGGISIISNNSLTNVNLPVLSSAGSIYFIDNNAITALSLPSLIAITDSLSGSSISNCSSLSSISFNNLSNVKNTYFDFYANKLTISNVNYILSKLVSITPYLTNRSINLGGQTPAAPPSGQGVTDKNTLISRGNTVTTD